MSIRNRQHSISPIKSSNRFFLMLLILACTSVFSVAQEQYIVNRPILPFSDGVPRESSPSISIPWETDYEYAMQTAETSTRQLLIYLYADHDLPELLETTQETFVRKENANVRQLTAVLPSNQVQLPIASACREFDTIVLDDCFVRSELAWYVLLKLPMDTKVTAEDGTEMSIFSLPGFEHMARHPGLVIIDFAHRDTPYYGQVVGILPFWRAVCPTAKQVVTFLELPSGTLTQRTLTYAVRIHPDNPLSSEGKALPIVVQTATNHALYQAERGVLGHQNFGARSRHVIDMLGSGMPSEICAQSWSNESMFEGAIGCMRAWRHSTAHWSIARKSHRYYGYDMAQGKNGAWYAVGFFIE